MTFVLRMGIIDIKMTKNDKLFVDFVLLLNRNYIAKGNDMAVLKERCPNCGGTIVIAKNASFGECEHCGATYSLSDLQKIKEEIAEGQQIIRETDCDCDENKYYESALDTSEADEISLNELCKKSELALESEQWQIANDFSDEIIRRNPKYAKAYLYKLLAEYRVFKKEELAKLETPFDDNDIYRLLIRFSDIYLKTEIENYSSIVKNNCQAKTLESQYQALCRKIKTASIGKHYLEAANGFHKLGDYKDSKNLETECLEKFKNATKKEHKKKIIKRFFLGIVILGIVFTIVGLPLLKKASYRLELFSVEVTDKVNVDYDDYTASFVFKFNISVVPKSLSPNILVAIIYLYVNQSYFALRN